MIWTRPVSLVNARVASAQGECDSIRFTRRILGLGEAPRRGDHVLDLRGCWVLPGLINAHDHLELNHYGPQHAGAPYINVQQWVDDMRSRLREDPAIARGRAMPLPARLWAGGFKNLLSGVTLVAHHNPTYPGLHRVSPVRVLERFGWAHSFAMEREPVGARGEPGGDVVARFRQTPPSSPFILHLGEGRDRQAHEELPRLEAAEALAENTVLVHGVAINEDGWDRVGACGASTVWCPASNLALLGATLNIRAALNALPDRVALGTDSRLSGARDLLDELQVATRLAALTPDESLSLVTTSAAAVLRQPSAGRLSVGADADLIVLPPNHASAGEALSGSRRHDLKLVVIDGRPQVCVPEWQSMFGVRGVRSAAMRLDGSERVVDARLARAGLRCAIQEPGVDWCH